MAKITGLTLLLGLVFSIAEAGTKWTTKTLYAHTAITNLLHHKSGDNYIYKITPSSSSSNFYLTISWLSFKVEGYFPDCTDSYVEVYLTSSYQNIGRFCSGENDKPFTMYSADGYAKIHVYQDKNKNDNDLQLKYNLMSKSFDTEYNHPPPSMQCRNAVSKDKTGKILSTGWPTGYQPSMSPCSYTIIRGDYDGIKIAFMDVSLNSNSRWTDTVKLYGSDDSKNYKQESISGVFNSNPNKAFYISYSKYFQIEFNRPVGSNSTQYRGFAAGYIQFDRFDNTKAIIIGFSISGGATVILICSLLIFHKKIFNSVNEFASIFMRSPPRVSQREQPPYPVAVYPAQSGSAVHTIQRESETLSLPEVAGSSSSPPPCLPPPPQPANPSAQPPTVSPSAQPFQPPPPYSSSPSDPVGRPYCIYEQPPPYLEVESTRH